MATKTSTKAKTNTAKATKTTKSTTKAASAPKKSVKTTSIKDVNVARLRSLHMMSAGLFILLAILAGFFMSRETQQITVGYVTEDTLTGQLAPAIRSVYDIEFRWLLGVMLAASAVLPVLYLSRLSKSYEKRLAEGRFVPWRWIDFAITGAFMVGTVALLAGMTDLMALKMLGWLVVISFGLSGIVEWHYQFQHPAWKTFIFAFIAAALPMIILLGYALNAIVYGSAWWPWYAYALYAIVLAGFSSIFYIQLADYRKKRAAWQKNYLIVERNYLTVNLLAKTAFAVVLIVGLMD